MPIVVRASNRRFDEHVIFPGIRSHYNHAVLALAITLISRMPSRGLPGRSAGFKLMVVAAVTVFALLTIGLPVQAAVGSSASFPAARVDAPPKFDPALSDPAWQKALVATGFQNLTTHSPATLATTAYLLYDDKNIYVAFRAEQRNVPIHASQTTDNIGFGQDDLVGVGLDTSGADSAVYYFETSPRGVRYQQAIESTRYAPTWYAVTNVDGNTWTAMLTIPLKDLRAAGGSHQTWRINFIRNVAGVAEHYTWAYDGLMQDGQPPMWPGLYDARWWPTLRDIAIAGSGARPKPRVEIYGLESAGRDRNVFQQTNNTFATQSVRNYGLDFVYPVTSTIAAVGTLNPDFSNVEVDQQTIVPQEFPRNLAEYRPFFAQGNQYFTNISFPLGGTIAPPDQVLYTPSIGTFDRGFKVEGTYGFQQIGALAVRSTEDGERLDDEAFSFKHAPPARNFLYWENSVFAHHDIGNDDAVETGIAGRNLATGFVWGYDQTLEERRLIIDPSHKFAYGRSEFIDVHRPNYEWNISYLDISPGYGPIDGFTTVNDIRGPFGFTDWTTSTLGLKNWTGFITADRYLTRAGSVHQADFFGTTDLFAKGLLHINLTQATSSLKDPILTGGVDLPFNQSSFTLGYRDGTPSPIDFTYGAGPFSTFYLQQFNVFTTRAIGTRFNISATYAGTHERSGSMSVDGQMLRSLAFEESLGPETNLTLALRAISGRGGFALPGVNFAAGLHNKFASGSELFVSFGTPAAPVTLNRFILKYLWRIGGGAGT